MPHNDHGETAKSLMTEAATMDDEPTRTDLLLEAQVYALLALASELQELRRRR